MNTAPDRSACDPVIYWQSRFELMRAENVRLEHRNAELVAALREMLAEFGVPYLSAENSNDAIDSAVAALAKAKE